MNIQLFTPFYYNSDVIRLKNQNRQRNNLSPLAVDTVSFTGKNIVIKEASNKLSDVFSISYDGSVVKAKKIAKEERNKE